jgi:DNA-binding CsgD family transcriptional regulator
MNGLRDEADLGRAAFDFAVQSQTKTSIPELTAALQAVSLPLGITAAASGYVSGPRAASLAPFHFTTWPEAWVKIYLENEFLLADPLPRWARASGRAITWSALFRILPPRDAGRRIIEAASAFGYAEGMAIPARGADNALGLVAFASSRPVITQAEQMFLTIIGRAAFEAAERIETGGKAGRVAAIMTEREIECLGLLVHGHSDREISRVLGVTEATVRFHIHNARQKSGAVSRTHMAVLATTQGYVSF